MSVKAMHEIRIAYGFQVAFWRGGLRGATGVMQSPAFKRYAGNGLWFPETDNARCALAATAERMNATYGDGSHWIERREA